MQPFAIVEPWLPQPVWPQPKCWYIQYMKSKFHCTWAHEQKYSAVLWLKSVLSWWSECNSCDMRSDQIEILQLFCWPMTLWSLAFPMINHAPLVAGSLPIKVQLLGNSRWLKHRSCVYVMYNLFFNLTLVMLSVLHHLALTNSTCSFSYCLIDRAGCVHVYTTWTHVGDMLLELECHTTWMLVQVNAWTSGPAYGSHCVWVKGWPSGDHCRKVALHSGIFIDKCMYAMYIYTNACCALYVHVIVNPEVSESNQSSCAHVLCSLIEDCYC